MPTVGAVLRQVPPSLWACFCHHENRDNACSSELFGGLADYRTGQRMSKMSMAKCQKGNAKTKPKPEPKMPPNQQGGGAGDLPKGHS